ncbi:MAG TPA: UdgX family uracil-DNA binding protein [Acidobacteriaceae bacterium]|jgi:DNA polymerase|nr:UdgX family uracil-DNA binding protein [Acidobacteriaceae bacterium]
MAIPTMHLSADNPAETAAPFLPKRRDLASLQKAAHHCQGCPLYENATQTVFGAGRVNARLILVGEQPGDREDREGAPFVGPAGLLLDSCLADAGIDRDDVYLTNAVKHFKWEPRGKRRIHKKPSAHEIAACRPWLDAEIEEIQPEIIVCLGATAAQAVLGHAFRVTQSRGKPVFAPGLPPVLATVHPSSIPRTPDHQGREQARRDFVQDLRAAMDLLHHHRRAA